MENIARFLKKSPLIHPASWVHAPNTLQLDTHNHCNLDCQYCNVQHSFNLPKGTMPNNTITQIITYFKGKGPRQVAVFANGEPLLEDRLPWICSLAQENGFSCLIDTNGTLYENRMMLLHPNLRLVRFTISAATPETYMKVHGKPLFNEATSTFRWFQQHKLPTQKAWLHFICTRDNEHEVAQWIRMFRGTCQTVFPVHKGLAKGNSDSAAGSIVKQPYMVDENGGTRSCWPNSSSPTDPCPCWTIMAIGWNGEIMQCVDYPYKYNYGRVGEVDLLEAWHERNRNKMDNPCCNSCSLRFPTYKKIMEKYVT